MAINFPSNLGFNAVQTFGKDAVDLGGLTGVTGAASGATGLLTTLGSFGTSFALSAAPKLLEQFIGNSQANAARKQNEMS